MTQRFDVFSAALRALDGGRGVALATVVNTRGSTPRHLGARMAITDDGEQWSTVGGGRIEQVVVDAGRAVARGAPSSVVQRNLVRDLGMCCGGAMDVAITQALTSRDVLEKLALLRDTQVLLTPVCGAPLQLRAPLAGDPPAYEPRVIDGALVERIGVSERAILCGFGHITRALGPLLAQLGFSVIVCDDGETNAVEVKPVWAAQLVETFTPNEIERQLGGFGLNDRVLILTRDHAIDQRLLEGFIAHPALDYLGLIGSRRKLARFRQRLIMKGLLDGETGRANWGRLRSPIGLNVGAETPEEIAVAIAAELISLRRRGTPFPSEWRASHANGANDGIDAVRGASKCLIVDLVDGRG